MKKRAILESKLGSKLGSKSRKAGKQESTKKKLPDRIIPICSADKEGWTEKWDKGRNLLDFPHPWRGIFSGPPSSGKSCTIKNVIIRANPPFEKIIVVHYSPEDSTEWNDVNAEMINVIPSPHDIEVGGKKLLILEDLDLSSLTKEELGNLNRLYGYASSHKNLSIALTCQNSFDAPVSARRVSNLFILYRQPDMNAMAILATRTGLKSKELLDIFSKYINHEHGSLWIDLTKNTPAKLRIDGYNII